MFTDEQAQLVLRRIAVELEKKHCITKKNLYNTLNIEGIELYKFEQLVTELLRTSDDYRLVRGRNGGIYKKKSPSKIIVKDKEYKLSDLITSMERYKHNDNYIIPENLTIIELLNV